MIHAKGIIEVHNGYADTEELLDSVDDLPDGEFGYLLFDKEKNRSLPQLKYLFGVVLKTISEQLDSHPPVDALYRYFEEIYAPILTCNIQGEKYEYFDLKNAKSVELDDVITKIIQHAAEQWGISMPSRDELKTPEAHEVYVGAYAEMWKNLSRKI